MLYYYPLPYYHYYTIYTPGTREVRVDPRSTSQDRRAHPGGHPAPDRGGQAELHSGADERRTGQCCDL